VLDIVHHDRLPLSHYAVKNKSAGVLASFRVDASRIAGRSRALGIK
jgi:hypothetical protein